MTILPYKDVFPVIHKDALISDLATIIGDVEIDKGASVFPGAVLRGDMTKITVGKFSNIQDNAVLHGGDKDSKNDVSVFVGDYVTVGHGAVVHGYNIADVCLIDIRSIIYSGSRIGEGSIIGMNSLVTKNTIIPKRSVVVGSPGRIIRSVDDQTFREIKAHALNYYELAKSHKRYLF